MSGTVALAKRNIICFLRDRASVAFSLLGVLVVVGIYLLFLRNMLLDSYPDLPGMGKLMDSWVLAGILSIVPVTTSAGSLQSMVEDRANGRMKDIMVTPMKPFGIAAGYILSTSAIGLLMSLIAFALSVAYLAATGCPMDPAGMALCAVLLVPSSLTGSAIVYALTSFMRSPGAFSGFFVTISVLMGFLTGVYMPMGTMPSVMQTVGTLMPASHFAALMRDAMASEALESVFEGAPADIVSDFRTDMGFDLSLGGFQFEPAACMIYACAVAAVFLIIAVAGVASRR